MMMAMKVIMMIVLVVTIEDDVDFKWHLFSNSISFYFRSINYDERDPFLCNACGFCKYAKFDYNLTARSCCAVDPIENEEDRKKVWQDTG